jgi:hypothetical protein
MRLTGSRMVSQCLPDKQLTRLWVLSVVLTGLAWWFLLHSTEPAGRKPGLIGLSMLAVSATFMGVSAGSLIAALVVASQVFLGRTGGTVPLVYKGPTPMRVALFMYVGHVLSAVLLSVGLSSLGGHWMLPGPWYLGLLPFVWR